MAQTANGVISYGPPPNFDKLFAAGSSEAFKAQQKLQEEQLQATRDRGFITNPENISLDGGQFLDDMTKLSKYDSGIWQ